MTQQADWDIVTDVGITALAVAAARAIESHRANPLVSDPYAELFVAAARPQPPMPTRPADAPDPWQDMGDYLGVRSRFFDEYFAAGATRQAVLLAAGLDVRGYRLDWPAGTVVYELDVPKVLQFKQNVLADNGVASRTEVRNVDVDLRDDWPTALQRAGFDRTAPTSWLAEGLLPFLPNDAVERLFTLVDELSAPGSRFAVEHIDIDVSDLANQQPMADMAKDFGFDITDMWPNDKTFAPVQWLADHGWRVTSTPVLAAAEGYGRPLRPSAAGLRHTVLITATKG
ncbi:SAM-dependent methyltransferase [Kutzneria kofuensis]|uniref:S-adenosyl-L-methionine-dependent methyltransferase n=1 Tax=Kutzneria kofuensis TaxID=103725 RepID=A0A7W9KNF0_9PSEU|nr:SAM-dependent methyltransferase [Kutzneria kofuensis]MBB5895677.1 methyltransferase (TIGR00027 family) [Kutzneria kofuensis]